jgi:hypothetical protein
MADAIPLFFNKFEVLEAVKGLFDIGDSFELF